MLRAQGWEPGQYLGAKDAAHAEWHTEASTSHIRVTLKDDNLGLGAKRNNGDECTGLDAFQHLLGRLNGKSEEALETEKKARDNLKLNLYVERKIGTIRFVSGGWLVGDQLQEQTVVGEKTESSSSSETEAATGTVDELKESKFSSKRSKKRKAEESQEDDSKKRSRKEKKKRKAEAVPEMDSAVSESKDERKKSRKRKAEAGKEKSEIPQPKPEVADLPAPEVKETKEERKERKAREKREMKERKDKRKSEKKEGSASTDERESVPPALPSLGSGVSTPNGTGSGSATPIMGSARYLARSRFIAQKKMAYTDTSALNQVSLLNLLGHCLGINIWQIFMIKS